MHFIMNYESYNMPFKIGFGVTKKYKAKNGGK